MSRDQDLLLGKLAVHYKVVAKEQVMAALQAHRQQAGGDFGAYLVSSGLVSEAVLAKLRRAQDQVTATQNTATQNAATQNSATQGGQQEAPPIRPASPAQVTSAIATPAAAPTAATPATATVVSAADLGPSAAPQPATIVGSATSTHASPSATTGDGGHLLRLGANVTLHDLLKQTQQLGASDFHLHSGAPLKVRLHGDLVDAGPLIEPAMAEALILGLLDSHQKEQLQQFLQLDFAYSIDGVGRFRANTYRQQQGLDAVFRSIPLQPPTLEGLGLPTDLDRVIAFHQGLVLFTGPAGSGKSSTMAAMVNLINQRRSDHILTVEDPIEFVHSSRRCLVNQREVGQHTSSFGAALRGALREDPDIIVIGELRDLETISLALTAAETGHLVLGTLHTNSAMRTINRLLGAFPPDQQNQIRTMLSESLRAVVSQRLLKRADGAGQVAAIEVLMNTHAVANLIRDNKTVQITSQMQTGATRGMVLYDTYLAQLVAERKISREQALATAEDPKRFH